MPSFDIVSEADIQEVRNAVDQANRETGTRFDLRGVDADFELGDGIIKLHAEHEFQLKQLMDILRQKMVKRGVDLGCLDSDDPVCSLKSARQEIAIRQGDRHRDGEADHQVHQGRQAQGPGADPR